MLRLTLWMNMPSFYQGDLFRALTACEEVDLEVIFAKDLTPDRSDLGWHKVLTGFSYRFLDKRKKRFDAIRLARSQRDRLHVINGLWAEQSFAAALVTLAISGSSYVIYSEGPDPKQARSIVKRALRYGFGRVFVPRAAGALSVSGLATEFFRNMGIPDREIYPFGYFRSSPGLANGSRFSRTDDRIEVVFAGQFVRRKGIDLLVEALAPLFYRYPNLFLTLIGGGKMLDCIREQAADLGVLDRLVFEGVIPADQIPARLAVADALVLPSRWDGWGMVVNEAFSVGVPVIVSDRCGAADLIQNGINGYVFRSEDTSDLNRCLGRFLDQRSDWPRFRTNSAATGRKISVEEVVPYLVNCLKHMTGAVNERPRPPWMQLDTPHAASL